jgi:hypothetical protein
MEIFQNGHYRSVELNRSAFQPTPFVTETSFSRTWSDSEKYATCGRADLAAFAVLRAIRCTNRTASWPDALRLQPPRLVKCPGWDDSGN